MLLPQVTPHTLRRTFASLALAAGWDPRWGMGQLGHTDSRFTSLQGEDPDMNLVSAPAIMAICREFSGFWAREGDLWPKNRRRRRGPSARATGEREDEGPASWVVARSSCRVSPKDVAATCT
jgi:hypothetical protein